MPKDHPSQTRRQRVNSDSILLTPQEPLRGRAVNGSNTGRSPHPFATPSRRAIPSGRASKFTTPSGRVPRDSSTRFYTPDEWLTTRRAFSQSQQRTPEETPKRGTTDSPTQRYPSHQRSRPTSTIRHDPSATMTPRRPRDCISPTVDLMRVLAKCWDDDSQRRVRIEVKDGLLNGRCEEVTGLDGWDPLRSALNNLWHGDSYVKLRHWIMSYKPDQSDAVWYSGEKCIGPRDERIIADPYIGKRPSDPARMGISMSARAYFLAVDMVEALSMSKNGDLQVLVDFGINPFFILYACADACVPMPSSFSKEFLWKFLDSIVRGQCWLIFGAHDAAARKQQLAEGSSAASPWSPNEMYDPEGIVHNLMSISYTGRPSEPIPTGIGVSTQLIHISTTHWLALGSLCFRHALGSLEYERAAPFAVLDVLTRVMKTCTGGTLEIHSDDMLLLWGIYEQPMGEWLLIKDLCKAFKVNLRARFASPIWRETWMFQHPENRKPLRDPEVVAAVLKAYVNVSDNDGAKCLAFHLGLDIPPRLPTPPLSDPHPVPRPPFWPPHPTHVPTPLHATATPQRQQRR